MKRFIIAILVLLGIGAVAVVTCPDRQAHKDAIMSVVNESINDELQTDDKDAQMGWINRCPWAYLVTCLLCKEDLKKALYGQ